MRFEISEPDRDHSPDAGSPPDAGAVLDNPALAPRAERAQPDREIDYQQPSFDTADSPTRSTHMGSVEARYRTAGPLQPLGPAAADTPFARLPRGPDYGPATDPKKSPAGTTESETFSGSTDVDAPLLREHTSEKALPEICEGLGVETPEGADAVRRAYDTVYDKVAPFVIDHVAEMVSRWKDRVVEDPDHRFLFLGRDASPLAAATMAFEPEFYARHCVSGVVTRWMVEAAIQDEETSGQKTLDLDDTFRKYKNDLTPDDTYAAKNDLTAYLDDSGIEVTEPGHAVTVVDTGRKGSTQEGLTVLYPSTRWLGDYLFLEQSPADTHGNTKIGYALHTAPSPSGEQQKLETIDERGRTLAHPDMALAIEDLLHGPWSSARGFREDGQPDQVVESPPVEELNHLDIAPDFHDRNTRLAAAQAMLLAVRDRAVEVAQRRARGAEDWRAELRGPAEHFVEQVGLRISDRASDPDLAELLGSFARRTADRHQVAELRAAMKDAHLDEKTTEAIWRGYQDAETPAEKEAVAADPMRYRR